MAEYATIDTEPVSGGKPTDVAVARKRLNQAIEATNQNRTFQVDDVRFAAGSPDNKFQWPQAVLSTRETPIDPRPCLTVNKLPQHINQITNEQRQNRPSIKVSPVDDKGDKEVAEILTGLIRHIEYQSDADVAYSVGGQNQVEHGEGYVRVLTDYVDWKSFDQDIVIMQIKNSFSVYMDPLGLQKDSTGRYCEWAFVVEDLAEDEFKRQHPKAKPINWELVGTGDDWKAWFPDSSTVRVAEYFCYVYKDVKINLFDLNGEAVVLEEGEPLPPGLPMGVQPIKTRTAKKKTVMWQKMNGCEVIEARDWAGSFLPIVRFAGNEWYIDGKMVVSGIVRNAKDAQRMFNYWKSTETETLALAPKAPFVGPAEAFEGFEDDWQQANTKSLAFLKYNQYAEGQTEKLDRPERQIPPMPPVGIVNAALGAADDIKSATGQYDPSLGNNPQAKSGVALAREQRKTDIGTFHYIDNQARGVKQLGRILVDLAPKIYDTRRVARILGEDGNVDHVTLDPDAEKSVQEMPGEDGKIQKIYNLTIGKFDVTVTVGPGYTSKRQEAAEFMAQVLQGNKELMAIMGDLYFEMMDVPGAEKIAERLKKALPPGLAEPEEGEEDGGPVVNTPKGPLPIPQAEQMLGELFQATQQQAEALEQADVAKAQRDAMLEQNKASELEIKKDELKIKLYEAQTERIKVTGTLSVDEMELDLKGEQITLEHRREVHALDQAAEIHENENVLRGQELESTERQADRSRESTERMSDQDRQASERQAERALQAKAAADKAKAKNKTNGKGAGK